ncbi:MAG: Na/Pi cotransporter family protein, partial [Bacteroidales bacterium]|nr:Na/Pi cotransporter family protein [Bacteroidales bacterium]
ITNVVWPAFLVGIILIQLGKHRYIGDFLFGLSFLLFALGMLKQAGTDLDLASNPAVVDFFASFKTNYGTILLFLLIGTVLTAIVQSSAALMAITMVLCSTGAITIFQGIALVMGENIGTTVTANLAALSANTQARRTAMAHMFFNVFGVIWVLIFFFPFVRMVCGIVGLDPEAGEQSPTQLSFALATFHTFFNVINTAILIWFIPQIEKIVCAIIRPKKTEEEDEFRLQYIRGGLMKTPEISVLQAQKEIVLFGQKMQYMYELLKEMYNASDEDFAKLYDRVEKYEDLSDRMENEIGKYLGDVGQAHLSDETKGEIRAMLRQIGELESVGDSFFNLARILRRKRENKIEFSEAQVKGGMEMVQLLEEALTQMNHVLVSPRENVGLGKSAYIEARINDCRNRLKQENIDALDQHVYGYDNGTVFMDLIGECEKSGDYIINVVEARVGESYDK